MSRPNVAPTSVPSLDAHVSVPNVVIGVSQSPNSAVGETPAAPTAQADAAAKRDGAALKPERRDTLMSPPLSDEEPASEERVRVAERAAEAEAEAEAQADAEARVEAEARAAAEAAAEEAARLEAARIEAARVEAEMIEAAKAEAAMIEAAMIEAAKEEAARVEAAKVEEAKLEAARLEAAKVEEAKLEAARIEAAKVEAAKLEAARLEAEKIEEAKLEAARIAAEKVEEAKIEAARVEAEKIEQAKLEAAKIAATKVEEAKIEAAKISAAASAAPPKVAPKVESLDKTIIDAKPPVMDDAETTSAKPRAKVETLEKTLAGIGEPSKAEAKVTTEDDVSVPPVGDLAVVENFFSEADVARLDTLDDEAGEAADKAARKSDPEVVKRRAKLARYVTWAVGVSAALCLVAVVRTTFSHSSKNIAAANAARAQKTEAVVPKAAPPPAIVDAPKAVEPAPGPAKPVVTGDAKEEKAATKKLLEKGKLAEAIEAGERSVTLDETDSEAWLLLGAAYQEKGKLADAQRAYKSCLEKGAKDKFQRECRMFVR